LEQLSVVAPLAAPIGTFETAQRLVKSTLDEIHIGDFVMLRRSLCLLWAAGQPCDTERESGEMERSD
jgi:hypothetical protein